jgi:hypothetical protein
MTTLSIILIIERTCVTVAAFSEWCWKFTQGASCTGKRLKQLAMGYIANARNA